jgi:hypothetical protein
MIRTSPPKILLKKIPSNLITPSGASISASAAESQIPKRVDLASNLAVAQNYRVLGQHTVSASSFKCTPSKPTAPFQSMVNLGSALKNKDRFGELSTPSKLMKTELEERRKAELAAKEAKDRERLERLERQKIEKAEDAKKTRMEKAKKVEQNRLIEENKQKEAAEQKQKAAPQPIVLPLVNKKLLNSTGLGNYRNLKKIFFFGELV